MKITKIVGQFIVETPLLGIPSTNGYVTEDGEVYINFKGKAISKEEINKNALSIIGFSVSKEKRAKLEDMFDSASKLFGIIEIKDDEPLPKVVVEDVSSDVLEDKEVVEEADVVEEDKPAPKRRGRRRKES